MSDAPTSRTPWLLRAAERTGATPLRVALAVGVALAGAFAGLEAALGRFALIARDAHTAADFHVGLTLCALTAYLAGAFPAAVRGAERTLVALAPALSRRADAEEALASVTGRRDAPPLRRAGLVGVGVALLVPFATNLSVETWNLRTLPFEAIAHRALLAPLGWLSARFGLVTWRESRRLAALGARALRVDLLDLRSLAPLSGAALRTALLGAGLLSGIALGFRGVSVAPGMPFVVAFAFGVNLAFVAGVLWLALRGGREAIVREKARADADANARIRALQQPGGLASAGALADALAWKAHVERLPDWPVDVPTLRRFVLPLALPLASVVAGALLETVLGSLLD